jgi:hypothetical protein
MDTIKSAYLEAIEASVAEDLKGLRLFSTQGVQERLDEALPRRVPAGVKIPDVRYKGGHLDAYKLALPKGDTLWCAPRGKGKMLAFRVA